jgi:septal ring factor EnvC (AmiA/AmiB activator)
LAGLSIPLHSDSTPLERLLHRILTVEQRVPPTDLETNLGTNVRSAGNGTVVYASDQNDGDGVVIVVHSEGTDIYFTVYGYL